MRFPKQPYFSLSLCFYHKILNFCFQCKYFHKFCKFSTLQYSTMRFNVGPKITEQSKRILFILAVFLFYFVSNQYTKISIFLCLFRMFSTKIIFAMHFISTKCLRGDVAEGYGKNFPKSYFQSDFLLHRVFTLENRFLYSRLTFTGIHFFHFNIFFVAIFFGCNQ